MKTVLCFGDSNTWGQIPGESKRYGKTERWPAILQTLLADEYDIIEEGLPGRTTVLDDPFADDRSGLKYLRPCLLTHLPDLVIIMLGTNDLKTVFGLSATDISFCAARLVEEVQKFNHLAIENTPKVLLVSPPTVLEIDPQVHSSKLLGSAEKSQQFHECYSRRAEELGCEYFNAAEVVSPCPVEGVHWPAAEHKKMANAIADKVRAIYSESE